MSVSVTATSRLKKDLMRLNKEPIPYVRAAPLPENILEWHYVIFGAPNTPYEGGVYHGKLLFPSDFPFKPPSILMLTPSGRFQVNTRLCLSISDFHPDTWNPAWTVGTILCGLLSFMNESQQTLGSVNSTDAEKKVLARRSRAFNLKNPTFCKLFDDIAKKIREEQRLSGTDETDASSSNNHDGSAGNTGAAAGAGSGLVANLIVIVGIVVIAFAIRHVILTAQEQDPNFK